MVCHNKGCDHDNPHSFTMNDNPNYFKPQYYAQQPNAPRYCVTCGEDKEFGTHIKVNGSNPVYACKNNHTTTDTPCVFAYCSLHYNMILDEKDEKETNKRSRKTKPIVCLIH